MGDADENARSPHNAHSDADTTRNGTEAAQGAGHDEKTDPHASIDRHAQDTQQALHGVPTPHQERTDLHVTAENARFLIDRLLQEMAAAYADHGRGHAKATDLHINPGRPPDYRIERVIRSVASNKLTQEEVVHLSNALMNDRQRQRFEKNHCIDCSYHLGKTRFRVNIVESFNGRSISIRRFEEIQDFSSYNLPHNYIDIAENARGFVIMSGSTGSGKTTSIAAMLDHVNRNFHRKICTIEDPIEYVYTPKKSIIVQLEIGDDGIPNEDIALRNLVRMDPDAGLAGEMRDRHSLEAALKTAQAGHLIFGTLHCEGVGQAFDRILAYYDTVEQQRILGTLADNLAAIINQRLLPCIRPAIDVVPAYEIFMPNPLTRRYIREMRYNNAVAEMDKPAMKELGCVTYVDSLYKLVTEEWVEYQMALEHAGDKAEKLKSRLKGIAIG
jgi:pilus retraction protein PilT